MPGNAEWMHLCCSNIPNRNKDFQSLGWKQDATWEFLLCEFHVWTTLSWHVQLGEKGDLQRNLFWEWASWGSDQRHRVWCRQDSGSGGSCKTGVLTCQADNHRCTHLAPSLLWVFLWVQTLLNNPIFPSLPELPRDYPTPLREQLDSLRGKHCSYY